MSARPSPKKEQPAVKTTKRGRVKSKEKITAEEENKEQEEKDTAVLSVANGSTDNEASTTSKRKIFPKTDSLEFDSEKKPTVSTGDYSIPKKKNIMSFDFREGVGEELCSFIEGWPTRRGGKHRFEPVLEPLHRLVLGRGGIQGERCMALAKFKGFPLAYSTNESVKEEIQEKLLHCSRTSLRDLAELFSLPLSGTKEDFARFLCQFLEAPSTEKANRIKEANSKKRPRSPEEEIPPKNNDCGGKMKNEKEDKKEARDDKRPRGAKSTSESEEKDAPPPAKRQRLENKKILDKKKVLKNGAKMDEEEEKEKSQKEKSQTAVEGRQSSVHDDSVRLVIFRTVLLLNEEERNHLKLKEFRERIEGELALLPGALRRKKVMIQEAIIEAVELFKKAVARELLASPSQGFPSPGNVLDLSMVGTHLQMEEPSLPVADSGQALHLNAEEEEQGSSPPVVHAASPGGLSPSPSSQRAEEGPTTARTTMLLPEEEAPARQTVAHDMLEE